MMKAFQAVVAGLFPPYGSIVHQFNRFYRAIPYTFATCDTTFIYFEWFGMTEYEIERMDQFSEQPCMKSASIRANTSIEYKLQSPVSLIKTFLLFFKRRKLMQDDIIRDHRQIINLGLRQAVHP